MAGRTKICRAAVVLIVCLAAGNGLVRSWPARADTAVPVPDLTVPPVTVPPVTVPPVTVPPPTLPPATVPPVTAPSTGSAAGVGPALPARPTATAPTPAPAAAASGRGPKRPAAVPAATDIGAVPLQPAPVLTRPALPLRRAVADGARRFAFPFVLAALVLAFLVLQHRIGGGDPRLVAAPVDDDLRLFR